MIDYTRMIGPVLLIDATMRSVAKTLDCCPNEECEAYWKYSNKNFCSKCGNEIMEHHYVEDEMITWGDFVNSLWVEDAEVDKEAECLDLFICPEYLGTDTKIVVVSNITAHNKYLEADEFVILNQFEASGRMRKFKSDNADYLKLIEDFFGVGNVTIEIAVCCYTS